MRAIVRAGWKDHLTLGAPRTAHRHIIPKEGTMKRFHVHVSVPDLDASIGFYSRLFGVTPSVRKPDYAKWMLDDPRVNFAISTWNVDKGINHLGLQADSAEELQDIAERFA